MGVNPRIRELEVGIKEIRTIKIYPLSIADQEQFTDTIVSLFNEFFVEQGEDGKTKMEKMDNVEIIKTIFGEIKKHIRTLIKMTTNEDPNQMLNEMDTHQLSELVDIFWESNYAFLSNNKVVKQLNSALSGAGDQLQKVVTEKKTPMAPVGGNDTIQ